MSRIKFAVYQFVVIGCVLGMAGCVLKDVEKNGVQCPPVVVDDVRQQPYVPILNLHCFKEDIVIPAESADDSITSCEHCTRDDDGAYVCDKEVGMQCLRDGSAMLRAYALCDDYREKGVLDRSGTEVIAFIKDHFGHDIDPNALDGFELKQNCPLDYNQCFYFDGFRNNSGQQTGGYGCVAKCEAPMLYCAIDGKLTCVDPLTNDRACGAKGGCFDSNENSPNWSGERCGYGATCQSGECKCESGLTRCSDEKGGDCIDTTNDEKNCGPECKRCEAEEVCEDSVCKTDNCKDADHPVCSKNNCENSDEQCGKSCSNCTGMTGKFGVMTAVCNKVTGECEITECLPDYELGMNGDNLVCTKKSEECHSGDITYCSEKIPNAEVQCNDAGQCELIECNPGFIDQGDGHCVSTDDKPCEEGGSICNGGASCINSVCQCPEGEDFCGGKNCVPLNSDERCGSCENNCNTKVPTEGVQSYSCKENKCVANCIDGYVPDSGGVNCVQAPSSKCEEGGTECPAGQTCKDSVCVCPDGYDTCGGSECVSLNTDDHCGSCTVACSGDKYCSGGTCQCPNGSKDCGSGLCVPLNTASNCGACNHWCESGECDCSGSSCSCGQQDVCDSNQQKCGGVCRDSSLPIYICNGKTDINAVKDDRLLEGTPGSKNKYNVYGYHDAGKTKYRLLYNNEIAYISASDKETTPCLAEGVIHNTTRLKCRKDMTTNYDEIDSFNTTHPDICIYDLNPGDGWYGVFCGSNCHGYVMREYVEIKKYNSFDVCE